MTLALVVLLLPFLQLGLSFYASFSTLAAVLCLASAGLRTLLTPRIFACLFIVWAMISAAALHPLADTRDILRAGREGLCFLMIIALLRHNVRLDERTARLVLRCLGFVAMGLALMVIAQTIGLRRGVFLSLPHDLFVINSNTLPTELDLRYSRVRPSGPFGEPSYLAAASTVLVLALAPLWPVSRQARYTIMVLAVATFLSMSMLGIASMSVALGLTLMRTGKKRLRTVVFAMIGIATATAFIASGVIADRTLAILHGEDLSFNSRIAEPLLAIPYVLGSSPFGIPIRVFIDMGHLPGMSTANESFSHNAIFNTLINYGIIGVAMLVALIRSARGGLMIAILFVLLMQNGAFWSFDKVTLVAMTVVIQQIASGRVSVSTSVKGFVNRSPAKLPQIRSKEAPRGSAHADTASHPDRRSQLWRPGRRDFRHYPLPRRTGT